MESPGPVYIFKKSLKKWLQKFAFFFRFGYFFLLFGGFFVAVVAVVVFCLVGGFFVIFTERVAFKHILFTNITKFRVFLFCSDDAHMTR